MAQLRDSGFFADVRLTDKSVDYAIAVTKARFISSDTADLAKAALAGATLFVLPISSTHEVLVEVVILWREVPINKLSYAFPIETTMSLLSAPEQGSIELAGNLAAKIIEDAKGSGVFTGPYLADALQATNYSREFTTPESVDVYRRVVDTQQAGPMEGAWLSYIRPEFSFDEYAINIYPARSVDWDDSGQYLTGELAAVRAQVEAGIKDGAWTSAVFAQESTINISTSAGVYSGLSQSVALVNDFDESMVGRTYVFLVEDKVLRFINVVPSQYAQPSAEAFLIGFFESAKFPPESVFMAELRKQSRAIESTE